jgi:hypothetical protein
MRIFSRSDLTGWHPRAEKLFLRAMSELGSGPYRTGDVAEKLGVQIGLVG